MRRLFSAACLSLLVLNGCGGASPAATTENPALKAKQAAAPKPVNELDKPLPVDARIKTGQLANGLRYYILPHAKPEKRAQLWLAVNAGSILEDDDQRGLAHFVEHMGFNGTKRFPKHDLIEFMEKSGVRMGADLNAYTSFDETVYTLQVPTDNPALVNRTISILRDWAGDVTFDPQEVEKERGVVLEEWRLGRGAAKRIADKQALVLFNGSKYADRLTIGKPEIINTASRDTLVRFYKDWYRPDQMAVIAVGDFVPSDIEAQIKTEFSSLEKPVTPRPRQNAVVPSHEKTLVSVETDPEMPAAGVTLLTKFPHRPEKTARDYRRQVGELLFNSMLNSRLDEMRRKPDAPFLSASSSSGRFVRSADSFRQHAVVKEDGIERGFGALLEEVLRVERHGFTTTELDRARSQVLRSFQQSVKERDKRDGREFAEEIVRHFLTEESMPGREAELALVEKFLPTYTVAELNMLARTLPQGSRVLLVTGPAKMSKPNPDGLLAIGRQISARDIKPYEDQGPGQPLMDKVPAPGVLAKTNTIPEIGVTEWTLGNGVRVVLKPTEFANDEVRVSAFSPGGSSLVKDADFTSARFADDVVAQSGLGPFDVVTLRKALAGKVASVSARIGEMDEGLTGRASPTDLETLFQMIHLSFTSPRRDQDAFSSWRTRQIEVVKNRRLSPEATFAEELLMTSTQNHPRRQLPTPEILQAIDLDKALSIYKDRFGDASDFTFVFVGNMDLERMQTLAMTYLGSLPAAKRKETWRDVKVEWPSGVKTKEVVKGSEPKARVSLTFHGKEKWSKDAENDIRMLSEVLRHRLRETLREDMGGVYGVQISANVTRRPRQEYVFNVSFGCAPDNVEKLKTAVFEEIKMLQQSGIKDDYIAKIKEARRRTHEVELKDNAYWLRELERAYTYGDDPKAFVDINPWVDKVSSDRVRAAAKKYVTSKQYVLGVLKPETSAVSSR
jgi:zinc protease